MRFVMITAELLRYAHPAAVQRTGFREFRIAGERYRLLRRDPEVRDTFVAMVLPEVRYV